jgi:hypothetical protein
MQWPYCAVRVWQWLHLLARPSWRWLESLFDILLPLMPAFYHEWCSRSFGFVSDIWQNTSLSQVAGGSVLQNPKARPQPFHRFLHCQQSRSALQWNHKIRDAGIWQVTHGIVLIQFDAKFLICSQLHNYAGGRDQIWHWGVSPVLIRHMSSQSITFTKSWGRWGRWGVRVVRPLEWLP